MKKLLKKLKQLAILLVVQIVLLTNVFATSIDYVKDYRYKNVVITFNDGEVMEGYFHDVQYERSLVHEDKERTNYNVDYNINKNLSNYEIEKRGYETRNNKRLVTKYYLIVRHIGKHGEDSVEYVIDKDDIKYIGIKKW